MTVGGTPMVNPDLINAILELSEKDFLDLIDIRLNRPKGLRIQGEYVEIIDANDKPSIVERWSALCLEEQAFLELATTKSIISHNGTCSITVNKYYNQALALRKWILRHGKRFEKRVSLILKCKQYRPLHVHDTLTKNDAANGNNNIRAGGR